MSHHDAPAPAQEILDAVNQLLEQGTRGVFLTVVNAAASSLRVGAKLLARDSGETVGSLGDVGLDRAAASHAQAFLHTRDEAKVFRVDEFARGFSAFADAKILFERIEAEPRLVIAGAGHVGASLARLAATVGYQVTLIDDRADFVDRNQFANKSEEPIKLIAATDWQTAIREAIGSGRSVSVAIVTRGHRQDEDCLRAAIEARPDYIGMIGSKRRTNIVLDKLREEGADENELRKVRAPIGLDIGAVSPEEVALAILAEIVAERRGGSGAPLSIWRRS